MKTRIYATPVVKGLMCKQPLYLISMLLKCHLPFLVVGSSMHLIKRVIMRHGALTAVTQVAKLMDVKSVRGRWVQARKKDPYCGLKKENIGQDYNITLIPCYEVDYVSTRVRCKHITYKYNFKHVHQLYLYFLLPTH